MNRGRIETITPEEWDKLMAVNLKRALLLLPRSIARDARAEIRQDHQHRFRHGV